MDGVALHSPCKAELGLPLRAGSWWHILVLLIGAAHKFSAAEQGAGPLKRPCGGFFRRNPPGTQLA
jgi:hypothetical protein